MKRIAELSKTAKIALLSMQCILISIMLAGVLFLSAYTTNWIAGWSFVLVYAICNWISSYLLFMKVPDLLDERKKKHANIKKRDKVLVLLYQLMYFPTMIVSGLEHRFNSSATEQLWPFAFLILIIASFVLITWAPLVNKHLETYIRIQHDRDHTVCDKGPYRVIRHPAYLGLILLFIGMPLSLGSVLGLIPAGFAVLFIIVRTSFEDQILKTELKGYAEYSMKTKYRLFPLIW